MHLKIYQINPSRDRNKVKFWELRRLPEVQNSSEVDESIYDNVFDAEMDEMSLQEIYDRFNQEKHPLYRGHSLFISDVVVVDGQAYFCENSEFHQIEFDESATHKKNNLIKVLYVEPHRKPFVTEVENTLDGLQKAVKGMIQCLYNRDRTIMVVNEEGKLNGMEGNRRIEGDVLVGPFFIAGDTGEDFCSLTEKQIKKYAKRFEEPEEIPQSEIDEYTTCKIYMCPI